MDLRTYLRTLRSRWRLIVVCFLVAVAAAAGITFAISPQYEASSQLFVSTSQTGSVDTQLNQGGQFAQQRVKSYADIISSPLVTAQVVRDLGLDETPESLAKRVSADAPLDTVLINVHVRDRSAERARDIVNAVSERFTSVASELERPQGTSASPVKVSVTREASTPESPVTPNTELNLALGAFLGLVLGAAAAVVRETLDTTVKSSDDVQAVLGLPTLGQIAFDGDAVRRPLIVHDEPHSIRSEAFRQVRTNLQFVDVDRPPRSIVITSALPGEGKSTTTCNIAIALSQAGVRVVLVEADLRRPRLASYMGLEGAVGLTNVLVGSAQLADVLQPWGSSLMVLPSGPTPPNPSELLGSLQMQDLLQQLEGQADLVLLDAPPLLPVTDAAVLSSLASGTVVVVRAGKTTRDQATRAMEILRSVDTAQYGAILNMVPTKGPGAHRYGYYGYYGPSVAEPSRRPALLRR